MSTMEGMPLVSTSQATPYHSSIAAPPIPDSNPDYITIPHHREQTVLTQAEESESDGWLPATDSPAEQFPQTHKGSILKSPGTLSPKSGTVKRSGTGKSRHLGLGLLRSGSLARADSSSRKSMTASVDRGLGGYTNGPTISAPRPITPLNDDEMQYRTVAANDELDRKQRDRIAKGDAKNSKKLSKIVKKEARTEQESLNIAINELAELQKIQRAAVKQEAKCLASQTKLATGFQKIELDFITARTRFETARAHVRAGEEALDNWRNRGIEATERMQDKSREVEALRTLFSVDEREREVKLTRLLGKRRQTG